MMPATQRLAGASARRPWLVVGLWIAAISIAGYASSQFLADSLTTQIEVTNDPEAQRAADLIEQRFGAAGVTEVFILTSEDATVTDGAFERAVRSLQASASDGGAEADDSGMLTARSLGTVSIEEDFNRISEEDLAQGETFGILVALVVLVFVFGAVVAGVVPLIMGVASIAVALGITALVGLTVDFSFFVTNIITMMGLAIGIDYSLFIVSRFREERAGGRHKLDAIGATGATAGRAVLFSGLTVVLAILASTTLLPALLSLLGDRVNALRVGRRRSELGSESSHRFWDGITRRVMGRPVISLVLGAGILIAAASSYLNINTGTAGVSSMPEDAPSRQAFEILATEFSGGLSAPIEVVVEGEAAAPEIGSAIRALEGRLAADGRFGPARTMVNDEGNATIVSFPVKADPTSGAAMSAIAHIREVHVPAAFAGTDAEVLVGGETAFNNDVFDAIQRYTPIVFAFVLGLSFLLLMVAFRSIVVPLKAIVLNLLSVGAAYGLMVLVFQEGVGADLFGFGQGDAIEAWLPLFLFSILFGLSMDYHVFLLSRIKERFDLTRDNTESVAYGLRTTGGLITGAAAIMVAVFGGFAAGDLAALQQMGFGLGAAVLIDATLIRSVLVPASMKLLGDRNWYLPKWLQWLPNVTVERTHTAPAEAPVVLPEMVTENA